jgi:hypothetical protein
MSSREEKLDYPYGEVLMVGGMCLFGESADIKNDCEDTADNLGDDNAS